MTVGYLMIRVGMGDREGRRGMPVKWRILADGLSHHGV